jgi:hypothetical protein
MVEGASGKVFANIFPAKAEAPYFIVGVVATIGFLCISTFPVIGYFSDKGLGAIIGLLGGLLLGALFAIPIFALAAWVSAKV